MRKFALSVLATVIYTLLSFGTYAQEGPKTDDPAPRPLSANAQKLVEQSRGSVVQVSFTGRDGKRLGMGTGFVISADGMIATNLHVIGEARPIFVEFADKKKYEVKTVHASDRALDLAIVKIDASGLKALKLGNSDESKQGESIVAVGNPHGLRHSVVSGIVSGHREIDGRGMLQLAMPIEPGNSGGPVLNAKGEVVGVVTMKSTVTQNLGFAAKINHLKPLIEKPNPVEMPRWLTIGTLDDSEWTPMFGAKWMQRAGRIIASGEGDDAIGRRSICLSHRSALELPFELAVNVRLDDESGAAGLVFHSDGDQKHYGFYPSNGRLRLSRFDGATVFTWKVLREVPSKHYQPGQWNHLKVRFEKDCMLCYINDQLVIKSTDNKLPSGQIGLAKFRHTKAEFRGFSIAKEIAPSQISEENRKSLAELIDGLPSYDSVDDEQLAPLAKSPRDSTSVLRSRADELQARAEELRRVANDLHVRDVTSRLGSLLEKDDLDLVQAAMLIARLDDEELVVGPYVKQVDKMAGELNKSLAKDANEKTRLLALNKYLFTDNGFHGSRTNYYHQANSYLSSVLDDREGLPITLSLLYMELGRRIGLKISGVGLPGHFIVKQVSRNGDEQLIDVFDNGRLMQCKEAANVIRRYYDRPLADEDLRAATSKEIVLRMLLNLRGIAERARKPEDTLRYLEAAIAVEPDVVQERLQRAEMRFRTGRRSAAVSDVDWVLEKKSDELSERQVQALHDAREYFLNRDPPTSK